MVLLIVAVIALAIGYKIFSNKVVIKFPTFFRKGFKLRNDDKQFGVYTFTGKQGDGKTYSCIDFINEILKKGNQNKVITNVESFAKNNKDFCIYNADFYDIIKKFNSGEYNTNYIIFFDEIFTLLEKGKLNKSILSFISQLRKRKIVLVTTAQEWLEINVTFRRYVRYQVDCKMLSMPFFNCAISINHVNDGYNMKWDNLQNEFVSPIIRTTIKKCGKKIADSYDTYEVIKECV